MMSSLVYHLLVFLCYSITKSDADYVKYYYDYECNEPLVATSKLTATSSLRDRGPDNAKLYGLNAWTASESDFDQQLIIDLGSVKNITRVATQGRAHSQEFVQEYHISYGSNGMDYVQYKAAGGEVKELRALATRGRFATDEYVTEFMLQYSDDGEGWRTVSTRDGNPMMFEGNNDGNTVRKNEFEVPIIAQYIRINPMRWRDKISMRVEVYGCDYVAETLYFNGTSLVKMDLLRDPISASRESIRFRFKTSTASGALLYSRGTQGDYIALQLRDNRLVLNIDLGELVACTWIRTSTASGALLYSRGTQDQYSIRGAAVLQGNPGGLHRAAAEGQQTCTQYRPGTSTASGALLYSRGTQGDYIALQLRDNRLVLNIDLGEPRTSTASGALLYSRGTQGDYIALQLRDNRLVLNIDLGSGTSSSFSVGSLLDDNIWHDVVISRNRRDVLFSVDRVIVQGRVKGEFSRLNLNRALYIGGVPNFQEGLVVTQNFTGCVENMYLNATNIIADLKQGYDTGEAFKLQKVNTLYACPEPPVVPITFLKASSYAKLRGYSGSNQLNISLEFRTYETHGLLIYHKFKSEGYVKVYIEEGKVKAEMYTEGSPKVKLDNYEEEFNDGRWHALMLTMQHDLLTLAVDYRPVRTTKKLRFITGPTYYIAGGAKAPPRGFIGCMRKIAIDGSYRLPTDWKKEEYCCPNEVVFDACQMIDRCNPNPCEHGGVCTQTSEEFNCNCQGTGYAGAVCHTSVHPLSCQAYKNVQAVSRQAEIQIDVDGSGPLPAFPVTCEFYSDGRVITAVQHSVSANTVVDGYQEPGSFRQDIVYEADRAQLEALLNRSESCWQRLEYMCRHSRLLNSPSEEANFHPFAWWVSRTGQRMDYWAGAQPGSRMCQCGVLGSCADPTKWCNCDAELTPLNNKGTSSCGHRVAYWLQPGSRMCQCGVLGSCADPTKWCNCDAELTPLNNKGTSSCGHRVAYWLQPGSRMCQCGVLGSCADPTKWCNCDAELTPLNNKGTSSCGHRVAYWLQPGSRMCQCGVLGSCADPTKWCNCDAELTPLNNKGTSSCGHRVAYWLQPGSRMCQCGVLGSCADPTKWCNCDAELTPLNNKGTSSCGHRVAYWLQPGSRMCQCGVLGSCADPTKWCNCDAELTPLNNKGMNCRQRMDYWAGAQPGSRMCQCGVLGSCADPTKWCNCDAELTPLNNKDQFQSDGGEITEKEFLPVKQLRFGDTGSHLDEKEGRYTLGPLLCEGDDLFSDAVTFRISDAVIILPNFDLGHSGDIYFEFKTTKENAVLLHSKGPQDYIKLSIIGGDQLQFQFQVGDTPLGVSVETSNRLADNQWHSVSIERNR
ncbi:laminin G domain-containing protein [Phthorimaea operculella]|nr:laminin G domain-containing protein [Phthorimaea operculella]